jgi:DNA-binding CsgD family transcriptional regulator
MHHWTDLINKPRHQTQTDESTRQCTSANQKVPLPKKRYPISWQQHGIYLTYREAQCMLLFIRGKTVAKVAEQLSLSPRTVEYYLNNIKDKVNCRTKSELIERIAQTAFFAQVPTLMPELALDTSL